MRLALSHFRHYFVSNKRFPALIVCFMDIAFEKLFLRTGWNMSSAEIQFGSGSIDSFLFAPEKYGSRQKRFLLRTSSKWNPVFYIIFLYDLAQKLSSSYVIWLLLDCACNHSSFCVSFLRHNLVPIWCTHVKRAEIHVYSSTGMLISIKWCCSIFLCLSPVWKLLFFEKTF